MECALAVLPQNDPGPSSSLRKDDASGLACKPGRPNTGGQLCHPAWIDVSSYVQNFHVLEEECAIETRGRVYENLKGTEIISSYWISPFLPRLLPCNNPLHRHFPHRPQRRLAVGSRQSSQSAVLVILIRSPG